MNDGLLHLSESLIQRVFVKIDALIESTNELAGEMGKHRIVVTNLEKSLDKLHTELKDLRHKAINDNFALTARVEELEKNWYTKRITEKIYIVWLKRAAWIITGTGAFIGWIFNLFHGKIMLQWLQNMNNQ